MCRGPQTSLRLQSTPTVYAYCLRLLSTPTVYAYCLRLLSTPTVYAYCLRLLSTPTVYAYNECITAALTSNHVHNRCLCEQHETPYLLLPTPPTPPAQRLT